MSTWFMNASISEFDHGASKYFEADIMSSYSSNDTSNETLNFLKANYPSYVKVVPKEVLAYGLPATSVSLFASFYILILSLASLSGNFLMILLYIR